MPHPEAKRTVKDGRISETLNYKGHALEAAAFYDPHEDRCVLHVYFIDGAKKVRITPVRDGFYTIDQALEAGISSAIQWVDEGG